MAMLTSRLTVPYEFNRTLRSRSEELRRRTFDLVIAVVALVLALPVLLVIAVTIRIDSPGPILFRQTRGGINGRPFRIYKFRTMTVIENDGAITQATRDDPRVTQVGRRLRQTSLDELPQLLNIIRGEMSARRTSSTRASARYRVRQGRRRLRAEKPGETGHHGMGADPWSSRRNIDDRGHPTARRPRQRVHREPQSAPRYPDPCSYGPRGAPSNERILAHRADPKGRAQRCTAEGIDALDRLQCRDASMENCMPLSSLRSTSAHSREVVASASHRHGPTGRFQQCTDASACRTDASCGLW